jgi:succinate dehydrogenase / fumarate reductase flavoprotein subunit
MEDYAAKAMELAPRDIVARAIQTEVDAGRGFENEYVRLDLTHLGAARIQERLPGIRQISMDFAGVDPVDAPIPVQPGQHYSMGGVASGSDGRTPMPGLYAAGECACASVHGANRLGGNSLLETVVFGKLSGATVALDVPAAEKPPALPIEEQAERDKNKIGELAGRKEGEHVTAVRNELRRMMFADFGVFRTEHRMKEGLAELAKLKGRFPEVHIDHKGRAFNYALINALELEGMLDIAEAVALGALKRCESRGSHARTDYPERDDENFLAHTIAYLRDGRVEIEHKPINLGRFPVKERKY